MNRIVHELSSLLPSEAAIEVDDEISFPRQVSKNVLGQQINTFGMKLFDAGGGIPTTRPFKRAFDANDRPYKVKFTPIFLQPTDGSGNAIQGHLDIPIYADPFNWTADELASAKYEAILAKNYPYQVVIGEEFLDDTHISTGDSSGYTLTEGICILAPSGIIQTEQFRFRTTKRVAVGGTPSFERMQLYTFDTMVFSTEPELPEGVKVYWKGQKWSDGLETSWEEMVTEEEISTTEGTNSSATLLKGIKLKIQNLTSVTFEIENYMLFLRLRNIHA